MATQSKSCELIPQDDKQYDTACIGKELSFLIRENLSSDAAATNLPLTTIAAEESCPQCIPSIIIQVPFLTQRNFCL